MIYIQLKSALIVDKLPKIVRLIYKKEKVGINFFW